MKKHHRPARITIDLAALQHNLSLALAHAGDATVLAVVKANAYGHGMQEVAAVLSAQADELDVELAVASLDDALKLRAAGITCAITCLSGLYTQEEIALLIEHDVTVVVYDVMQLSLLRDYIAQGEVMQDEQSMLSNSLSDTVAPASLLAVSEQAASMRPVSIQASASQKKSLRIWLKVDTGMGRLGFTPLQIQEFLPEITRWETIDCLGLLSHFANSDEPENPRNMSQLQVFEQTYSNAVVIQADLRRSMANSAALLSQTASAYDMVRPGIMLFGASPLLGVSAVDLGLRPVMTFASELISVKEISKGQTVGYGDSWLAPQDMLLGVVACGYGDGYPRHASNGTPVLVNGRRSVLIGRVSMDLITVDLRGIDACVGDTVILWGQGLPIEEVANHAGTISYELSCGVTERVRRHYSSV